MPTYNATGVSATLSVCDLHASLSTVQDLRQRSEQRDDAARIQRVFNAAQNLPERVIGEIMPGGDGVEGVRGVLQFIGANEDMPFHFVEVGKYVNPCSMPLHSSLGREENEDFWEMDVDEQPIGGSSLMPFSSTSSVDLQMVTRSSGLQETAKSQSQYNVQPSTGSHALEQQFTAFSAPSHSTTLMDSQFVPDVLGDSRLSFGTESNPKALVLDIELSHRSFLPSPKRTLTYRGWSQHEPKGPSTGKDMKIEVFVNGLLADVSFINARRSAVQIVDDKIRFAGMRVHRQSEKPWVYIPGVEMHTGAASGGKTAMDRWNAVAIGLMREAGMRGTDRKGDPPPSAEFLMALACVGLPARCRDRHALGVIDVVITAGRGKKFGPDTAYITRPTRLEDPDYTCSNAYIDPKLLMPGTQPSPAPQWTGNFSTSLWRVPQRSTYTPERKFILQTPTPTRTKDLTAELNIQPSDLKLALSGFENPRGQVRSKQRTLGQRLGDLKKMNPVNRKIEIARLKETLTIARPTYAKTGKVTQNDTTGPFEKKTKMSSPTDMDGFEAALSNCSSGLKAVRPIMGQNGAPHLSDPTPIQSGKIPSDGSDADTMITHTRIGMALSAGASPAGQLVKKIASNSPEKIPMRKTHASALANSPARVPVKIRKPDFTNHTPTSQHHTDTLAMGTSLQFNPPLTTDPALTPSGLKRGANRTSRAWEPSEKLATDVLRDFVIPEVCEGSSITYTHGKHEQRQIGKARGGQFHEETLVVGIRFVVV